MRALSTGPAVAQLKLVFVSEALSQWLTGSVAAIAFFAGWFARRQQYLGLMSKLRADHERRNGLILVRLAEARRQAASAMNENSMLKSEIAHQRARLLRANSLRAPLVESAVLRTPMERAPDRRQQEATTGFQDTQPWEAGSA